MSRLRSNIKWFHEGKKKGRTSRNSKAKASLPVTTVIIITIAIVYTFILVIV